MRMSTAWRNTGCGPSSSWSAASSSGPTCSTRHGIFFTDAELKELHGRGAQVAHCPSSNMRLGSGTARVRDMLDLGIPVSLAVDGSASNDSSDFLGEMRHALLLQRVARGSGALNAREVLRMATETGAAVLGFQGIGRISPGYAADLAVFDIGRMEYCGSLSDPFAALLFPATTTRPRSPSVMEESWWKIACHRLRRGRAGAGSEPHRRPAAGGLTKVCDILRANEKEQCDGRPGAR